MLVNRDVSILGIDMDDVTANLNKKALYYHNLENNNNILNPEDLYCWKGNWDLLKDYYLRPGIYSELEVFEGAKEVLHELSNDYHIIFITASPSVLATNEKLNWVDKHFPFIGSKNVIPTHYKHLINADLLFDDSPEFIKKFKGIKVLMDQIHNKHLTESDYEFKVHDWFEFRDIIKHLESERRLVNYRDSL